MSDTTNRKFTINRRAALKGMIGGALGANLSTQQTDAASVQTSTKTRNNTYRVPRLIWHLQRPKPALPNSYFWTWDHSTNWMLDDPGLVDFGCSNAYLKSPETYVEDYRQLTDLSAGLGIKGILIWGFLRDEHGGVEYAKRVADYAASKGVAIMPGVGTNAYGGIYYRGNHKYNIPTFVAKYPEASRVTSQGVRLKGGTCPTSPIFVEWLNEGLHWLFREFNIGGINLENGDFIVCHCKRCKELHSTWKKGEPAFWMAQYHAYSTALKAIEDQLDDKFVTWATYKGFNPGFPKDPKTQRPGGYMACERPALADKLPKKLAERSFAQWTLSNIIKYEPVSLIDYLDDGAPKVVFDNINWREGLKPPTVRNVGFIHHGSQWSGLSRHHLIISTIKESCLRAYREGLEGLSIVGEMSSMNVTNALNYLAFSHFIHWPEDSLRAFGRKTLGQVLKSEDEGEAFAELLAYSDSGQLSEKQQNEIAKRVKGMKWQVRAGKNLTGYRFWSWLDQLSKGTSAKYPVSIT